MADLEKTKSQALVLIVDDVEMNRFTLRNIISDMGYQAILAENGLQALKIMEHCRPSLILLDVSMPEMDGFEFCGIMKKDANTRDIPIIFISAYDEPDDVIKGFEAGGEDYITKPFIQEVVKARVSVHLNLYDATQNLLEYNRKLQASVNEQLKQMEQEKKNVLYALASVARENACYNENYMDRLQYNCKILSQAMQLSPQFESMISDTFVDTIELVAPLCDLGNVSIPHDILQKEYPLSDEEMKVMQTHTVIGAKILNDIKSHGDYNDFVEMSIQIANYHHENWDGSGYPEGLKENEIPLPAQIVAIASAYCALTEDRSYRKAYTREDAINIICDDAGVKYNQDISGIIKKISRQLH